MYGGFEIRIPQEFRDKPVRQTERTTAKSKADTRFPAFKRIADLGGDLNVTIGQAVDLPGKLKSSNLDLAKAYASVNKIVRNLPDNVFSMLRDTDTLQAVIDKVAKSMRSDEDNMAYNLAPAGGTKSGKASRSGRLYNLAYELADRLKHGGDDNDKAVIDKFIGLSQELVKRIPGRPVTYDFVVYPGSSSTFNQVFADKVAAENGGFAQEIKKFIRGEMGYDFGALGEKAEGAARYQERLKKFNGVYGIGMKDTQYFKDRQQFKAAWIQNEVDRFEHVLPKNKSTIPSLKGIRYNYRQYLRAFDPRSLGEMGDLMNDSYILIIDDNYVTGASLRMIHTVLSELKPPPRQIDVFVPLILPRMETDDWS